MRINLDTTQVSDAIRNVRQVAQVLRTARIVGATSSLSNFSPIVGFSTSGRTLGTIADVHAPEATEAVATHLLGIADTLQTALDNTIWADGSFSGILASLGNSFRNVAAMNQNHILATSQILQSVDPRTNAFATPPAAAGLEASLIALDGKFQATEPALALAASEFWASNATLLSQAMDDLGGATQALASSAETEWVSRAIDTIQQVQNAGRVYSANSTALAAHAKMLTDVAASEKLMTHAAMIAYNTAPNPALKKTIEMSYLAVYQPRATGGLATTVPQFNRLLPDFKALPGGSMQVPEIPVPSAPAFDQSPIPQVAHDALMQRGLGDLVHAKSPSEVAQQFGNANPDVMRSIAAGATPTQAASAAAPTMPPPSTLSQLGQVGGGAPIGAAGAPTGAGATNGFVPAALGGAGGPGAAGSQGRHGTAGTPGLGHLSGTRPNTPGAGGAFGSGGSRGAGMGGIGAGRIPGGVGAGSASGLSAGAAGANAAMGRGGLGGFGSGFGNPGAGSYGAANPGGVGSTGTVTGTGAYGSAAGTHGSAAGANGVNGAHGSRPAGIAGAPMGMAGRNQDRKEGGKIPKVKTVTSAVEREGNLKALLGDAPLLLPEVIGHNVRG